MSAIANQNGPKLIAGLGDVAAFYDGLILDLWGVVHDGVKAFPDTVATLQELRRAKRTVWLLSNAPRRVDVVKKHLADMGVSEDLYDGILTSGEASWLLLREQYIPKWGKTCFHLGPARDKSVHEGLGLALTEDIAQADFILNSGVFDHFTDTVETYKPLLEQAAMRALPMLCANPDKIVHVGDKEVLCPGALAVAYEGMDSGADVVMIGKPHRVVYRRVLEDMGLAKVLCVGDAIETDIAGATGMGLDSALVLSGIHRNEIAQAGGQNQLAQVLKRYPYAPTYALDRFSW